MIDSHHLRKRKAFGSDPLHLQPPTRITEVCLVRMNHFQYPANHSIHTEDLSYALGPIAKAPLTHWSQDISARSPVQYPQDSNTPRQSLDLRNPRQPRSAINGSSTFEPPKSTDEEGFEDVGLNDETRLPPKKRGIFARFGDNSENQATGEAGRPNSSHGRFHLPGRKRGQSGQGAELGHIDRPKNEEGEDGISR